MKNPIVCLLDVETTGMDDDARVVEIASMTGRLFEPGPTRSAQTLVDPGAPIPCGASAVHHITDDMVKGKPSLDEVMETFPVADLYVAHNAAFDRRFLPDLKSAPWACTMKCAYEQWPDAPSYGLQALRYWRKIELPEAPGLHAHRAMYDVLTLAGLFADLVKSGWTAERMIEVSSRPQLLRTMPFGKHKGAAFDKIDASYLEWLRRQPDLSEDMTYTLEQLKRGKVKA